MNEVCCPINLSLFGADPTKALQALGIERLPFTPVEDTDGTSKCILCKQVYSGLQQLCVKPVPAFTYGHGYGYPTIKGNLCKGDKYYDYQVTSTTSLPCGGSCIWTEKHRLDEQKQFLSMVIELYHCTDGFYSYSADSQRIATIRDSSSMPSIVDKAEKAFLLNKIYNIDTQLFQLQGAIKFIAEKMNAAGQNLTF